MVEGQSKPGAGKECDCLINRHLLIKPSDSSSAPGLDWHSAVYGVNCHRDTGGKVYAHHCTHSPWRKGVNKSFLMCLVGHYMERHNDDNDGLNVPRARKQATSRPPFWSILATMVDNVGGSSKNFGNVF